MWEIKIDETALVSVNYEEIDLPASFRAFKPILFKEENIYCCLLGPNPKEGIFGFGQTAVAAMSHWDLEFKKRLLIHTKKDTVAHFLLYKINSFKKMYVD